MSTQLPLVLARAQGENAAQACLANADAKDPGVKDVMFAFLVRYAQARKAKEIFTAEAISDAYAADENMAQPHDQRSWGPLFAKAANRGVLAIVDNKGVRRKGHGSKGAFRYRSLIGGKSWGWIKTVVGES